VRQSYSAFVFLVVRSVDSGRSAKSAIVYCDNNNNNNNAKAQTACARYPQAIVRVSHRRSIVHNCNAMAFLAASRTKAEGASEVSNRVQKQSKSKSCLPCPTRGKG
jgi:hypothetical protein